MSDADRVTALECAGYTLRQAHFLVLVAIHGGYFLRRQYTAFTGHGHGLAVVRFLDTLVRRQHAQVLPYGRHGHVYHLFARSIYAAISQEDNRNRRPAEWMAVTRKLMTLDFVLANQGARFYGTEEDKVALLRASGVPDSEWPRRCYMARGADCHSTTRYFVDKMPWYREPAEDRLWFAYINAETTLHGFQTFLEQYRALLTFGATGVAYVTHDWSATRARDVFLRLIACNYPRKAPDLLPFWEFCRVRRAIEANALGKVPVAELIRFREVQPRYATKRHDDLYKRWVGDPAIALQDPTLDLPAAKPCEFRVHKLPHRYGTPLGIGFRD